MKIASVINKGTSLSGLEQRKKSLGEVRLSPKSAQNRASQQQIKKNITIQLEQAIAKQGITRVELAKKLKTSRAVLNRTLDPNNYSITLQTLIKISNVLNLKMEIIFS